MEKPVVEKSEKSSKPKDGSKSPKKGNGNKE